MMLIGCLLFLIIPLSRGLTNTRIRFISSFSRIHSMKIQRPLMLHTTSSATTVTCPICLDIFSSRNKLYQHYRGSSCRHSVSELFNISVIDNRRRRGTCALQICYQNFVSARDTEMLLSGLLAEWYGVNVSDLNMARASGSSYRMNDILDQDDDVAASGDVFTFSHFSSNDGEIENDCILSSLNNRLDNSGIKVVSQKLLKVSMHAEQHCTSRHYSVVVPLYLFVHGIQQNLNSFTNRSGFQAHLKQTLKNFVTPKPAMNGSFRFRKSAAQKAIREKHRWHNFCKKTPVVLSPMNSAYGHTIDKFYARLNPSTKDIVWTDSSTSREYLVLEVVGDGFLSQQIRCMVGTAIAIFRGSLPADFATFALDVSNIIETPVAPAGWTFLTECRYGWHCNRRSIFTEPNELNAKQRPDEGVYSYNCGSARIEASGLADEIVASICAHQVASEDIILKWLDDLETVICPRIRAQLSSSKAMRLPISLQSTSLGSASNLVFSETPPLYSNVLRLLRQADSSGLWPPTSKPRSRIIDTVSAKPNTAGGSGSFSAGKPAQGATPRGNIIFGELVDAIFELEKVIMPNRTPSTMVAINRRASFRPHIDSGAGYGQSLSLIVGLGDYVGGEICVEGDTHSIRYSPLEFDGWKKLHWTLPFQGERFSLVWFTPAGKSNCTSPTEPKCPA